MEILQLFSCFSWVILDHGSENLFFKSIASRRISYPTPGITLVHGYMRLDPDLVLPDIRANIEKYINLVRWLWTINMHRYISSFENVLLLHEGSDLTALSNPGYRASFQIATGKSSFTDVVSHSLKVIILLIRY